jgi:uncharacterized protein (DUF3084 family)
MPRTYIKNIKKIEEEAPYTCRACIENQLYQLSENLNINTDEFETKATSPLTSPRTVIVTETDMIDTVAIQEEMTRQTSLLDHSEEQVQQGNGDNYKNAHGSSNTSQISTKSDDGKAETIYLVTESPLQNPRKKSIKELRKSVKPNVPTHKPEKLHESMNSSYITQLERKIRDRDNTIKLMEKRLTQLEQKQDTLIQGTQLTINTSIILLNTTNMSIPDIRNSTVNFNTSRVM